MNGEEWIFNRKHKAYGISNLEISKSIANCTDAGVTHLWVPEDDYAGSVHASGALCSKRVKEP